MRPEQRKVLTSILGEGFHTAFRKGTEAPQAHEIWTLIQQMPEQQWGYVLEFVADCLEPWLDEGMTV